MSEVFCGRFSVYLEGGDTWVDSGASITLKNKNRDIEISNAGKEKKK